MSTEFVHSIIESPRFIFQTTESWFDKEWNLQSKSLFRISICLKKGTGASFIEKIAEREIKQEPSFLEFYLSSGMQTKAEIRGYETPTGEDSTFDYLDLLVTLSPDQEQAISPNLIETDPFGY